MYNLTNVDELYIFSMSLIVNIILFASWGYYQGWFEL